MEVIERVWKQQKNSLYVFWDLGNEIWDFDSDGECRHYRMEKRSFISKNPVIVKETLVPLPFTPVPLEAIQKKCIDWKVSTSFPCDSVSKELKSLKVSKNIEKNNNVSSSLKSIETFNLPKGDTLVNTDSISTSSNDSSNEVWVSLSQWIPTYALYQPSLHKQANSELNDTPSKQFFKPKQNLFSSDKPLFI